MMITYQEMKAWAELTGRSPTPFEIEQISALDTLMFRVRAAPRVEAEAPQSLAEMASTLRGMAKAQSTKMTSLETLHEAAISQGKA